MKRKKKKSGILMRLNVENLNPNLFFIKLREINKLFSKKNSIRYTFWSTFLRISYPLLAIFWNQSSTVIAQYWKEYHNEPKLRKTPICTFLYSGFHDQFYSKVTRVSPLLTLMPVLKIIMHLWYAQKQQKGLPIFVT